VCVRACVCARSSRHTHCVVCGHTLGAPTSKPLQHTPNYAAKIICTSLRVGLFAPVHLFRNRDIQQVNTTRHSHTTSFNGNTHTCNEFMTVDPEQGVDRILSS
jgi:hypothetical protein